VLVAVVVTSCGAVLLGVASASAATAQEVAPATPGTTPGTAVASGQGDLAAAEAAFESAARDLSSARADLADLQRRHDQLTEAQAALAPSDRELAQRLAASRERAQRELVAAYISGTDLDVADQIVKEQSVSEYAFRRYIVRDRTGQTRADVEAYLGQRHDLDARVGALATDLADNERALAAAHAAVDDATRALAIADVALRIADHDAELAAARDGHGPLVLAGAYGDPLPDESGNAAGPGWAALRACESGGNYAAVSPSGEYRGAYQFDVTTWRGMGGTGDPAQARPAEQDYRAQLLYDQRGAQPWPVCGQHLLDDPGTHPVPAVPPPPLPPGVTIPAVPVPPVPGVDGTPLTPPTTAPPAAPSTSTTTTPPPPTAPVTSPSTVPMTTSPPVVTTTVVAPGATTTIAPSG
jgi:hypothetical protein